MHGHAVALPDPFGGQGMGHSQHLLSKLPEAQGRSVEIACRFIREQIGGPIQQFRNGNSWISNADRNVIVIMTVPKPGFHKLASCFSNEFKKRVTISICPSPLSRYKIDKRLVFTKYHASLTFLDR